MGFRVATCSSHGIDIPITKSARGFLGLRGYRTDFVETGEMALEAVRSRHYDLVLMDMEMPVMDGLQATQAIRALPGQRSAVPVIALTANALPSAAQRCRAAGMNDVVTKPVDRDSLFRAIDAQLAGRPDEQDARVA